MANAADFRRKMGAEDDMRRLDEAIQTLLTPVLRFSGVGRPENFDEFAVRAGTDLLCLADLTFGAFGVFLKFQNAADGSTYGLKIVRLDLEPLVLTPPGPHRTVPDEFSDEIGKAKRLSPLFGFCKLKDWGVIQGQLPECVPSHPFDSEFHQQGHVHSCTADEKVEGVETRYYGLMLMDFAGATVYDFMKEVMKRVPSDTDRILTSSDKAAIAWAVRQVARYAAQLLRALAAAEIDGINFMHCDLHFGNVCVLCGADSEDFQISIIDFGFSRV